MFFARAAYVFKNNDWKPNATVGTNCKLSEYYDEAVYAILSRWSGPMDKKSLFDPTIASLLDSCDVKLAFYAEGFN